jgi:hypothetical protein
MFWYLLLAHFIADYPLQPGWMVANKRNLGVLGLHVSVHFVTMLLILWSSKNVLWSYLLLITAIHFLIDLGKNIVWAVRPQWIIWPYVIDQLLHYLSLALISGLILRNISISKLPLAHPWVIYALGYLLVTYVTFISERVFAHAIPAYIQEAVKLFWPRLLIRAALLSVFLLLWRPFPALALSISLSVELPYLTGNYRARALITDLVVALAGFIFIRLLL